MLLHSSDSLKFKYNFQNKNNNIYVCFYFYTFGNLNNTDSLIINYTVYSLN